MKFNTQQLISLLQQSTPLENQTQIANPYAFRYFVKLQVLKKFTSISDMMLCAGGLVTYDLVLTAARCLEDAQHAICVFYPFDFGPSTVKVTADTNRLLIHPQYKPQDYTRMQMYDIGLIHLPDRSVTRDLQQMVIPLAPTLQDQAIESLYRDFWRFEVAGFGTYEDPAGEKNLLLRYYETRLINCHNTPTGENVQDDVKLCRCELMYGDDQQSWKHPGTCGGDFGSPLVLTDRKNAKIAIGVGTSLWTTETECHEKYPSSFAVLSLPENQDWLFKYINESLDEDYYHGID